MVAVLVPLVDMLKLQEAGVGDNLAVTLDSVEKRVHLGLVLLAEFLQLLVRDCDRHFLQAVKREG